MPVVDGNDTRNQPETHVISRVTYYARLHANYAVLGIRFVRFREMALGGILEWPEYIWKMCGRNSVMLLQ